jgi:hypothetical protein
MSKSLSNQSSNEDGPKSKSVGFIKIYNFALRFVSRIDKYRYELVRGWPDLHDSRFKNKITRCRNSGDN